MTSVKLINHSSSTADWNYYEWTDEEGGHSDNYIEIIQNISRNFNSMQLMRDRIVNKLYCRPLPQKPKVAAIE